jgi:hypothetical protein
VVANLLLFIWFKQINGNNKFEVAYRPIGDSTFVYDCGAHRDIHDGYGQKQQKFLMLKSVWQQQRQY